MVVGSSLGLPCMFDCLMVQVVVFLFSNECVFVCVCFSTKCEIVVQKIMLEKKHVDIGF